MSTILTVEQATKILNHWLNTEPNAYLGYRYARNIRQLLLKPMNEDSADLLLQWLKEDIPLFANLPSNQLSVVSRPIGFDKKEFLIKVGDHIIVPIPDYSKG